MVTWTAHADRLNDDALLAAIALGDHSAATVFVRRHQRAVYGLALTMCHHRHAAEDVSQQTFERLWRLAGNFDPRRASARTWILTITRRLCIDVLRTTRSIPLDPIDLTAMLPPAATSVEGIGMASVEVHHLRSTLDSLPQEQRRAVVLASMGGHTAAEIAQIEQIPVGTAKTRLRQGLLHLRHQLVERTLDV